MSATQRTASINGPQQSSRTNYALLIQQDISGVRNDLYSSSTATQGYLDKLYRKVGLAVPGSSGSIAAALSALSTLLSPSTVTVCARS